jgi:hypothetical protein
LATILQHKTKPYLPTKPGRPNDAYTNLQVDLPPEFRDHPLDDAPQAQCRHMAAEYLTLGKAFLPIAASVDSLRAHFERDPESLRRTSKVSSKDVHRLPNDRKHIIDNEGFGLYLRHVANSLTESGQEVRIGINTVNHTMAVIVKRKSNPDRIAVTCYDPNRSANHRRLILDSPDKLDNLKLTDMFDRVKDLSMGYFGHSKPSSVAVVAAAPTLALPVNDFGRFVKGKTTDGLGSAILIAGNAGNSDSLRDLLARLSTLPRKEIVTQLSRTRGDTGGNETLQNMLIQHNHVAAFFEFAQFLRKLGVSGAPAAPLLDTRNRKGAGGQSGYSFAMQDNCVDAMRTYAQALDDFRIPADAAFDLLNTIDTSEQNAGETGVFCTLQSNAPDALQEYCRVLQKWGIQGERAAPLFKVTRDDGVNGLDEARRNGHHHMIKEYSKAVTRMRINTDSLAAQ